jgi:hypothetical protein
MFKNLNLVEKIRWKSRISQTIISIIGVIALLGYYNIKFSRFDIDSVIVICSIIGVVIVEIMQKWINSIVTNPIYHAVCHASKASGEIA